jgi:hypothetical protein
MRAIVIESDIAERTRGLLLCISRDSTRASLTAAINPVTTAIPRFSRALLVLLRAAREKQGMQEGK